MRVCVCVWGRHNLCQLRDVEDMRPRRVLWVAVTASPARACPVSDFIGSSSDADTPTNKPPPPPPTHPSLFPPPSPLHTSFITAFFFFFHPFKCFFFSLFMCFFLQFPPLQLSGTSHICTTCPLCALFFFSRALIGASSTFSFILFSRHIIHANPPPFCFWI